MASGNSKDAIKITLEDLANVSVPDPAAAAAPAPALDQAGGKVYGSINTAVSDAPATGESKSNILLQGWFYLGLAGLLGAIVGWGIAEPFFVDGPGQRWGNFLMLPLIVMFLCVGFALAESIVERSPRKALIRSAMALPLGLGLGFIFDLVANVMYGIMLRLCFSAGMIQAGASSNHSPAWWISRGIAWMVFGVAGGAVYGIIGQSGKKAKYGILGGIIGSGLGGFIFDPISFATHGGAASRVVGFALFGIATGIAVGLVESALKDRWLYVTAGPLAGKQFILYKAQTVVGSNQGSDIYLFKDPSILPQHAVIEIQGSRVQMRALGNVFIAGQPVSVRVLQDGDIAQIGRYAFRYKEKQRS